MDEIIKQIDILLKETEYKKIQEKLIKLYFFIGKSICDNNYNIYSVENELRMKYGLLIGFTRRNIHNMITFYKIYCNYDIEKLSKISWGNHLLIMKQNNKDELINYCLKYNISKDNLKKIIKNGFDKVYTSVKLEENDIVTLEIIELISGKNK
jgi:hypothetical protein